MEEVVEVVMEERFEVQGLITDSWVAISRTIGPLS